ncbi:MAG: M56 family metallopeptidase [Anaeromyxobacteraceae bacterium]
MSPPLRLFVLTAAAWLLFAGAGALAMRIFFPRLRRTLAKIAPHRRAEWLVAAAGAPPVTAAVLVTACFLPSLTALAGLGVDHCPLHGGHHAHLCFAHLPARPLGAAELLLVGTASAVLACMVTRFALAQGRAWRSVQALVRASREDEVRAARPLAVTVGFWKPRVIVTSELRSLLAPEELDVVVEHERAHARRRDPLRVTVAAALAVAHLPSVRRAILRDLALACEEACDEDAAGRLGGDRLRVAETLVVVEKLVARAAWAPVAIGGGDVSARVESLLSPALPDSAVPRALTLVTAVGIAGAVVALAPSIHHIAETLLGFLAP